MSQLFISHSSLDNAESIALRDWLKEQGWSLFLDLDPEHGIYVGEEWRKKLRDAVHECEGMILLISEHWLVSDYCLAEYQMAESLDKPLFPLVIRPLIQQQIPHTLLDKWNIGHLTLGYPKIHLKINLPDGKAHEVCFSQVGLNSLKRGLMHAGLHPEFFQWPPLSQYADPPSPYKGLKALEQEDAGILFGRDGAIKSLMAELHRLRTTTNTRFVVIQGASGSGKSSFLRAGILPRLARSPQHFVVLPPVRPQETVLSGEKGLIESIVKGSYQLKLGYNKAQIVQLFDALQENSEVISSTAFAQLEQLLFDFIQAHQPHPFSVPLSHTTYVLPTLVLPLDQAEELFTDQHEQATRFLQLVAALIRSQKIDLLLLATIRTDAYASLQGAFALEDIEQYPFSLPRIAKGAFQQIIEGPAKLLEKTEKPLWVDPQLTDRLLKDLDQDGGKDALPLLAFTLERLYLDYGNDGKLELKEYLTFQDEGMQKHSGLGGLRGAVNIAIEEALSKAKKDPRIPQDHQRCMRLLRRAFIPALASIDLKTYRPYRKVAYYDDIPDDVRPLIDCLVESRLLTKDCHPQLLPCQATALPESQLKQAITIELAHESILRQWHLLSDWLKEDIADLSLLEMLQVETADWLNAKQNPEWLRLRGGRLQEAERLQKGKFNAHINDIQQKYLRHCRRQEVDELNKIKELAQLRSESLKRTKFGFSFSSLLLVVSMLAGLVAFDLKSEADQQTDKYHMEFNKSKLLLTEIGRTIRFLNVDVKEVLDDYVPMAKQSNIYAQLEQLRQRLEQHPCSKEVRQIATAYANQGNYTWLLGDVEKAKRYYLQAFETFKVRLQLDPNSPKAKEDLSLAYEKLGHLAEGQQNIKLALAHYQAAFTLRQQLAQQYPKDPKAQRHLSIAYKKLGDIYHVRHRPELALQHYQAALTIDKVLIKDSKFRDKNLHELSVSYHNLGKMMLSEHRYREALDYYQMALELIEQWREQDPTNQKALEDLSMAYEHIGDVKHAQHDLKQARFYYKKALVLDQQQVAQDPQNSRLQRQLGIAYEKLAGLFEQQADLMQATEYYQAAFAIFQQLVHHHPNNRQTQISLGIAYDKLGDLALTQKDFTQAEHYYQQGFRIFQTLVKQSPKNRRMKRLLSVAHNKLGDLAQAQHALSLALKHYQASFAIRYKLYLKRTDSLQTQQDLALSYTHLGDIARMQQNHSQAQYYYEQALSFFEVLTQKQPKNPVLFEKQAKLHQKLSQIYTQLNNAQKRQQHDEAYQKLHSPLPSSIERFRH